MQVIFLIPKHAPPNLPEYEDQWSDDFRDFISKCCVKNASKRPSAKQLQNHKWIKGAGSKKILQNWVRDTMPLLDEWRQQQRELEMGGGTGANTQQQNVENEYDNDTMYTPQDQNNEKEEYQLEYEDSKKDEDAFNGGTMLMDNQEDEFDGGTMMIALDDDSDNDHFDDSTMLFDEN